MRIAVHVTSDTATRAGRILLAERDLEVLGLLDRLPGSADRRVRRADDLTGFDVLFTDERADVMPVVRRAAQAGIPVVFWGDEVAPWEAPATMLVGANLASGIAPALASHEAAAVHGDRRLTIAWTEPGRPLHRGTAVPFPDPVGSLWSERRSDGTGGPVLLAAPTQGSWAGALVMVGDPSKPSRIVGVADDARYLESIALAAGAATVARGLFPPGWVRPEAAAEDYLLAALDMGLEVAGFRGDE